MSVIGIDLGTHVCSIALYTQSADTTLVLADDMGSRTIPSVVAFRGDEIIIGQAALSQQNKNPANTFDDVLSKLLYSFPQSGTVQVPVLDREVAVVELATHLFRNIHNQVKQQVGTAVRDSVVVVNKDLDEAAMLRLKEAAQAGGIRVKCVLNNTISSLLAYKIDEEAASARANRRALVVDVGYSQTTVGVYDITPGGLYSQVMLKQNTTALTAAMLIQLLVAHCAKDFQRKYKTPLTDSKRSMLRLQRECEGIMKMLSTSSEANMAVDALFEGMDYACKISRAKFEDLCGIPFMQLRNFLSTEVVAALDGGVASITHICLVGGLSNVHKVQQVVKAIFAANDHEVVFPKLLNVDSSEVQCLGAACHGAILCKQLLLDSAMELAQPATLPVTTTPLYLHSGAEAADLSTVFSKMTVAAAADAASSAPVMIVPAGAVLPFSASFPVSFPNSTGASFQVLSQSAVLADVVIPPVLVPASSPAPTTAAAAAAAAASAAASAPAPTHTSTTVKVNVSTKGEITVKVASASGVQAQTVTIGAP